jgi:hypothetical protein
MQDTDDQDRGYPHRDLPRRFDEFAVGQLGAEQSDGAGFIAHTLLDFLWQYQGIPLEELDRSSLDEYYLDFFPRKISANEELVNRTPELLVCFLEFAAAEGVVKPVGPLIELVTQNRENFIQAALNSSNYGPAKAFVMQMLAEGYDPTDQAQINEFMLIYNQRLMAQRLPVPPQSDEPPGARGYEKPMPPRFQATPRASEPLPVREPQISRNQPCPCGSGRKYKRCCGRA